MLPLMLLAVWSWPEAELVPVAKPKSFFLSRAPRPLTPPIPIPPDNPITFEKIVLGSMLFADRRLSRGNSVACIDCHRPDRAWADGRARSIGFNQQAGDRNSPTCSGASYFLLQFWDGSARSLEGQCLQPLVNPKEMANDSQQQVVDRLLDLPLYRKAFADAFPQDRPQSDVDKLAFAIATFERVIHPGLAPVDYALAGDRHAMSDEANRGLDIFQGKGKCTACHGGYMMSNGGFYAIGVDSTDADFGRGDRTNDNADDRKFKVPSLRNVALTAPYGHGGRQGSLESIVDIHLRGGNPAIARDRNQQGQPIDNRSRLLSSVRLSASERQDLLAFLREGTLCESVPNPYRDAKLKAELKRRGFRLPAAAAAGN